MNYSKRAEKKQELFSLSCKQIRGAFRSPPYPPSDGASDVPKKQFKSFRAALFHGFSLQTEQEEKP